jgi:hypothetical protein
MSTTVHLFRAAASRAASRRPKRFSIVGVFPLRVGVVDDQAEARAAAPHGGPLQHLKIAVGIAEGGNGTLPDILIDANRLSILGA